MASGPIATLTAAGTTTSYTVAGSSTRGCPASATANLTIYPSLLSIGPDALICRGDAIQLQA